ncbi:huntingtin-interacting protein k-like [Plasmopara halstedii]|uniref:Huntingtin-interacting protein k-like n=1 Tax=Plasmopara halstedii TaxID=4781 RepID=A0A0P1B6K8_PLAHL|nr:huntingtin-interacting protein k-like [Plasmopara halstedii]CEG50197.1 huntingtin-interacting protein k-like [Plasmopara halstedii]|eukprot:XP_024586566.1 huntingtin-interacting protein k-like [Plasmopara halstedii]
MSQTEEKTDQVDAGSDGEEETPQEQVKSKKDESNAMEKLTDLVEEKQMDENKMKAAFRALHKQEEADKEAERLLEKKLAAIKISKDEVELVAQEMEISTQQADRKLREADGDIVKCLCTLVSA